MATSSTSGFGKFLGALLPALQIGAPIVSGISQFLTGRDAAKQQRQISERNQMRIMDEAREAMRQMQETKEQNLGRLRAVAGASGFSAGGSPSVYQEEFAENAQREIDWTQRSATSRADIAAREGGLAADTTSSLATSALLGGLGKGAGGIYDFGRRQGWSWLP